VGRPRPRAPGETRRSGGYAGLQHAPRQGASPSRPRSSPSHRDLPAFSPFRYVVAKNYFVVNGPSTRLTRAFLVPTLSGRRRRPRALPASVRLHHLIDKGEHKKALPARPPRPLLAQRFLGLAASRRRACVVLRRRDPGRRANRLPPPPADRPVAGALRGSSALLVVSGIIVGILNNYDEFSVPALPRSPWNLVSSRARLRRSRTGMASTQALTSLPGIDPQPDGRAKCCADPLVARQGRPAAGGARRARPGRPQSFKLMLRSRSAGLINITR